MWLGIRSPAPSAKSCNLHKAVASMLPTATRTFRLHCWVGISTGPVFVQRRIAMGYYKRIPVYRSRNSFLKRLGLRFVYMKPSNTTFLTCFLILLAGVVMALSVENMLPENLAQIVMAQIREMGF